MVADYSIKLLQGKTFLVHRNTIQGMSEIDFRFYKRWHKEVLDKHELWDEMEVDLNDL